MEGGRAVSACPHSFLGGGAPGGGGGLKPGMPARDAGGGGRVGAQHADDRHGACAECHDMYEGPASRTTLQHTRRRRAPGTAPRSLAACHARPCPAPRLHLAAHLACRTAPSWPRLAPSSSYPAPMKVGSRRQQGGSVGCCRNDRTQTQPAPPALARPSSHRQRACAATPTRGRASLPQVCRGQHTNTL